MSKLPMTVLLILSIICGPSVYCAEFADYSKRNEAQQHMAETLCLLNQKVEKPAVQTVRAETKESVLEEKREKAEKPEKKKSLGEKFIHFLIDSKEKNESKDGPEAAIRKFFSKEKLDSNQRELVNEVLKGTKELRKKDALMKEASIKFLAFALSSGGKKKGTKLLKLSKDSTKTGAWQKEKTAPTVPETAK